MPEKTFHPRGQERVVAERGVIKIGRNAAQRLSFCIMTKTGCQQMIEKNIGYDTGVTSEFGTKHRYSIEHQRMAVGKAVDLAMKQNSFAYLCRILLIAIPFYEITDKIAHLTLAVVARKIDMREIIHFE